MYEIGRDEVEAVSEVLASGRLFRYVNKAGEKSSSQIEMFESEWAGFVGVDYCLSTTSGTASLISGMTALGIGPGDEVIIPGYTYIATALAVLKTGAIPVIVDIDESGTIDTQALRDSIGPRTRAVIPVHMMGMPCDMERLSSIARDKGLFVVEDACQAVGGKYRGRFLGTIGDVGAFSFNFYKIITSGEGGALVTKDRALYERAFMEHDGGGALWPDNDDIAQTFFAGGNYRNNEISAAILRVQLGRLPGILDGLRRAKRHLAERFEKSDRAWLAPNNDPSGDCGVQTTIVVDSPETREKLTGLLMEKKCDVDSPFDSGRHLFYNWDTVLKKRGAAHPFMDPYRMEANRDCRRDYPEGMLPRTRSIVARMVMIRHDPRWGTTDLDRISDGIAEAVRSL